MNNDNDEYYPLTKEQLRDITRFFNIIKKNLPAPDDGFFYFTFNYGHLIFSTKNIYWLDENMRSTVSARPRGCYTVAADLFNIRNTSIFEGRSYKLKY